MRIDNFEKWIKDKEVAKEEIGKNYFIFLTNGDIYLKTKMLDYAYPVPKEVYERIKNS